MKADLTKHEIEFLIDELNELNGPTVSDRAIVRGVIGKLQLALAENQDHELNSLETRMEDLEERVRRLERAHPRLNREPW